MTGWEPATEAEVAMRDALRAQDQELYFRILTRVDLLLPVSAEAPAGQAPTGWGTWTTGGRTHVLAFTSANALRACLGENPGTSRRVPYADLAADWPNHEWWLAVNPGLPIEGYLPAWFVAQLSRGDVRLPGRTMGARARLERAETAARARASATVPGRDAPVSPAPGTPVSPAFGGSAAAVPAAAPEPSTVPVPTAPVRPPVPPAATAPGVPPVARQPEAPDVRPASAHVTSPARPGQTGGAPARSSADPGDQRSGDRPGAGEPTGWSGAEPTGPGDGPGRPRPRAAVRTEDGAEGLSGWLNDLRRRPDDQDPFGSGPTSGRPGAAAANGGRDDAEPIPTRSFFEPASGRLSRRPSPLDQPHRTGDRALPPSRLGQGGQPFPRRRPLGEPVPEEATRAFRADTPAAPAPGFPRPHPEPPAAEPTKVFRPADPAAGGDLTQALPRRRPTSAGGSEADEQTQQILAPPSLAGPAAPQFVAPTEAEELPASVAEPVSGPPAPRRTFSPIVIEGTVIESRDLTEPAGGDPAGWADGRPAGTEPAETARPEPRETPSVAAANSAAASADADRSAPLWAGPAEPTVSFAVEPRTEPTTPETEPTAPLSEPTTPRSGTAVPPAEPTVPLFAATAPPAEPTVPLFAATSPPAEPTVSLFAPTTSAAEPTTSAAEPTTSAAEPTAPLPGFGTSRAGTAVPSAQPATPLFEPTVRSVETVEAAAPQGESSARSVEPVGPSSPQVEPASAATGPGAGPGPLVDHPGGSGTPRREEPAPVDFVPANDVEEDLLAAAGSGSTDTFLSTLLLARVLLPSAPDSAPGSRPGDPGFVWRTEELDGETYVVVYTSPERLADRADGPVETVRVKFVQLIRRWPEESWSFAVNPGTPVGAKYPGEQVLGLANWAAEVGLGDELESEPEQSVAEPAPVTPTRHAPPPHDPTRPVTMQKAIAASQLAYYLERGYDRVSGFVHRANELAHLTTPAQLYDALGLGHPDSPFSRDAEEIYLLRWPAHRPSLYRIPYGGQNEAAMRAMEGWVIERPPFRGNGFAPGESTDVVAEFKVDSARLPHGAQLWRIGADGTERVVAILDGDALLWRRVGEP
ncbi:SseB family protein [Micromonospora inositola]|uniref:SseB family protein n=1 Tax=Micromonospora inositola TaxID=47865 RepID=UPI0022B26516|nr:SseB family protein [Micromonospora inositola]